MNSTNQEKISHAVQRYHELLRGADGIISARLLEKTLRDMRMVFGDRPICRVLRPFFLTRAEADRLRNETLLLMRAFRKVLACLKQDAALRATLGLSPEEEAVLACDQQNFEPDQIARIDGFLVRDGAFCVIEYNAESPGGIAFGDMMVKAFDTLPVMEKFRREFRLSRYYGLERTLRQLRAAYATRRPAHNNPNIAIVDYKDVPTRREFEFCAEYFESQGCSSRIIDPSELRFDGASLHTGDFKIDVIYKRALLKEFIRDGGIEHPLIQAVKAGVVTCASGFGVHILYRKEFFAYVWEDNVQKLLNAEERQAVSRCMPWSRLVRDVETERDGRVVPLKNLILENQHQLVLKPTNEYGGKGVTLGWLVSPEEWRKTLELALHEPYLVQSRVTLPSEDFPVLANDHVTFERFYADINPYIWGGTDSEGFGGRLARGELLNVTAGGGSAVPVYVLED